MERSRVPCWICRLTLVPSGGFWQVHYILPFQRTRAFTCSGRRAQPVTILQCSARLLCWETESTVLPGMVPAWHEIKISLGFAQSSKMPPIRWSAATTTVVCSGLGPDGKLYIFFGDQGRRGQLQNLPDGPFGPGQPDDQFGGPEPDNAHLSGVILRLNDDGTAPADNPFF